MIAKASSMIHPVESLIVRGYSARDCKPVEFLFQSVPRTISAVSTLPLSPVSRPIYNLLLGRKDWPQTVAAIQKVTNRPVKGAAQDAGTIALLRSDSPGTRACLAMAHPIIGDVVAALHLSATEMGWEAEPVAVYSHHFDTYVRALFRSPSVSALLEMTAHAFGRLLERPDRAAANLDYVIKSRALFVPSELPRKHVLVASRWPGWQQRSLGFPAREKELAAIERRDACASANALRQMCSRALHLKIHDQTDG